LICILLVLCGYIVKIDRGSFTDDNTPKILTANNIVL